MARSEGDGEADLQARPDRLTAAAICALRPLDGAAGAPATPTGASLPPDTVDAVLTHALDKVYHDGYTHGMQSAWLESSSAAEQRYQAAVRLIAAVLRHHDDQHRHPSRFCEHALCRTAWEADTDLAP